MNSLNRDIQASHRILRLLREAAHLAEEILDQVPGLFILYTPNGEILRANPAAAQCLGCDPEEVQFHSVHDLMNHMSEWQRVQDRWRFEQPTELDFSGTLEFGENKGRSFLWFLRRFQDRTGRELNLLIGEEITRIQEFEKRLMRIYHSTPLGICVVNRDGVIQQGHSQFLEQMLEVEELEGKDIRELLWGPKAMLNHAERDSIHKLFRTLGDHPSRVDECIRKTPGLIRFNKNGNHNERWYKCSLKAIEENGICNEMLVLVEDQTEWIETEQRNREIENQSQALYMLAVRDALTGLYNRHYMKDGIAPLIASHNRGIIKDLSLCMIDVDHFKSINDTYGHSVGDIVLHDLGEMILKTQRTNDIAIRFGGEEFMVFLTTSGELALNFAERLRILVETCTVHTSTTRLNYTISLGIAEFKNGDTLETLISRADDMLYQSKRNGRNQTTFIASE